jgi:hypothetical protein
MQRLKKPESPLPPGPNGSLLAGMVIGTAIMTIATQAMALGIGAAMQAATLKNR